MGANTAKFIGQYKITALLGSGSMGRIYRVTIPAIEKTAAVKVFSPTPALVKKTGTEWLKKQFIHEARVIANIRHPNVVGIWGLEETSQDLFYLMDYFGRNLGHIIGESYWADRKSRMIPIDKACRYMIQILEGLSCLHEAHVIHRDIKPFNIMLSDTDDVKIVDFGLSKRRGEQCRLTAEKLNIGTPFYTAPELIYSPATSDHRVDLYSAGIILYRMVTGYLPGENPAKPSRLNSLLDEQCDQFILKAIAPDPDERFQTAHIMADELIKLSMDFKTDKKAECPDPELEQPTKNLNKTRVRPYVIRSEPARILVKKAMSVFDINDLKQPHTYVENRFEILNRDLVKDYSTDLIWQVGGSLHPMQYDKAQDYIQSLCDSDFGGLTYWRMPTVNEILSLLNPASDDDFCVEPIFSSIQKWLWSCDTRSRKSAWAVDVQMGFVTTNDHEAYNWIKAVSSVRGENHYSN